MIFCQKCGTIMIPAKHGGKTRLRCPKCRFSTAIAKKQKIAIKEEVKTTKESKIEVIDKKVEILPKTKEECPKCHHTEAFYWLVQTRGADEPETQFFKCTKCMHTWRKY